MSRESVDHRHEAGRLEDAGERAEVIALWVVEEVRVFRVRGLRDEPPHERRPVGDVAAVGVLAEVEGGVLGGSEPDEGGDDRNNVVRGGEGRPPVGVAEIGVADVDRFGVPRLKLPIGHDDA